MPSSHSIHIHSSISRGSDEKSKNQQAWHKYAEIQEPSDFVCKLYSYNSFYVFHSSENI